MGASHCWMQYNGLVSLASFSYRARLGELFTAALFAMNIWHFRVIFVYVAELYPTEVRSVGTGMGSMAARIGGVAAPYILLAGKKVVWLPLVVWMCLKRLLYGYWLKQHCQTHTKVGTVTIVGGVVSLMLPETLNRPIPQTIAETMEKKKTKKEKSSSRSSL